jgi:O-antigen/teichoic acid export membrane protein
MIKSATSFLGIQSLIAIRSSLYIVLLSILATESIVGLLNAVLQFTAPLILIFTNIALSIFPAMCKRYNSDLGYLKRITENSVGLLLNIAVPAAVGLFFLASPALILIYGEDFVYASGALQIIAFSLILRAPTHVLGQVLWASSRENLSFRIVVITTLIELVIGLILISRYGLIGAAIGVLASEFVDLLLHQLVINQQFFKVTLGRLVWRPVVASVFMVLCLVMMNDQVIYLSVLCAATLYVGVLIALEIWFAGGASQLKIKYLTLFSD